VCASLTVLQLGGNQISQISALGLGGEVLAHGGLLAPIGMPADAHRHTPSSG
jgi:hypothetical protein